MPEINPEDQLKLDYIEKQLKSPDRNEGDKNFLAGVKKAVLRKYKTQESK